VTDRPVHNVRGVRAEEIANSVSHGVGFVAALAIAPVLILDAMPHGTLSIVGASVFATTMAILYLASTLYHAIPHPGIKKVMRTVDHSAIYLLIAGTYTPFTLGVLRGAWGWTLFGIVWGLALLGVVLKASGSLRHPVISTTIYLAMGWLIVVAIGPLAARLPAGGLIWLAAGGLAYTGGVAFYAMKRVRYSHLVWHLFVLAGTACHVVAVIGYAA